MSLFPIKTPKSITDLPSLHPLQFKDINGKERNFAEFKGKKILIVNVASKCGFTPQYAAMEELHKKYADRLVVIGFPCNQFADQEPGTAQEIVSFCELNYGVSFLLGEKLEVKGNAQNPIYEWLTQKSKNGVKDSSVKWNFQKYLMDEEGRFLDYFYSLTTPLSSKITKYL